MTKAELRAKKIFSGQCVNCKKPATHGRMCKVHAERNAEVTRNLRARRKASGQCLNCHRKARGKPAYASHCLLHGKIAKGYIDVYVAENSNRYRLTGSYRAA